MKTVSSAEMRELDRRAIEEFGIPGEILMERAGAGIARSVERLSSMCTAIDPSIVLVAGKGNNGGDVFVTARFLKENGFKVTVLVCASIPDIKGDALVHLKLMQEAGLTPIVLPEEKDWDGEIQEKASVKQCDIVVDGILGTGINGAVHGAAAGAIRYINRMAVDAFVIAVDVPSGMNSDDGTADGDVVTADITVTMGLPKSGFTEPGALDHIGSVEVVDIGIPHGCIAEIKSNRDLIVMADFVDVLAHRKSDSHKGDFGHALLIGGANGFAGAIAMAAASATRSGVGLVTVVTPKTVAAGVCSVSPESMVYWAEETDKGSLRSDCLDLLNIDLNSYSAILIGPGMTTEDSGLAVIEKVLDQAKVPVIVDADALNICAGHPELLKKVECPFVLTPHPGEMARLMNVSTKEVQADRCSSAIKLAVETGAVVVLKGAGTVIANGGPETSINLTGNPGMAAGGMGDVLAGLLAGFAAQNMNPFIAAKLAVFLHGMAADRVAWSTSEEGLIASDVIRELPYVIGAVPSSS